MRALVSLLFVAALGLGALRLDDVFYKDAPDRLVASAQLGSGASYDGDALVTQDATWVVWIEHSPSEAEQLFVGRVVHGDRDSEAAVAGGFGLAGAERYASPRLTSAGGRIWLSYEGRADAGSPWRVYACEVALRPDASSSPGRVGETVLVSTGLEPGASALDHDAAGAPDGRLWVVWQATRPVGDAGARMGLRGTQYDVMMRIVPAGDARTAPVAVSDSAFGDWHPRIAFTDDGTAWIVWDAFDGQSFNVVGRRHEGDAWSSIQALADTDAFEARASIASDGERVWVAWEEGPRGWGEPYRSIDEQWNNATDDNGPVHRLSRTRLVEWTLAGVGEHAPVPMQAFGVAADDGGAERRDGARGLGVWYERPELAVDGRGRPWLFYRHFADLQLGRQEPVQHHVETGWDVYARALTEDGWSELLAFDRRQRDGAQRLAVCATADGAAALWTTGRTDRREDADARGLALANVALAAGAEPGAPRVVTPPRPAVAVRKAPRRPPAPATVGGTTYELAFGDLHRHTDLSLCFPFFDGSLDDAYRYAIEVARLDFVGVTDHARDLAQGDVRSQVWRRSTKAVERHRLPGAFVPYFAFERSSGATDHNVISLRDDVLRPHEPPLPEYWAEIDGDTFTLPHNTVPSAPFCGKVWDYQDDAKRPLAEVYQGMRDRAVVQEASVGLAKGYHLGFVASSDHMSTNAAFACVWTPSRERKPLFRSLQARRTYAATARIRLVVHAGDAWMGELVVAERVPPITVEVDGTAPLDTVELVRDGVVVQTVETLEANGSSWRGELAGLDTGDPTGELSGETWLYVHVLQADGEQAWSSPLWFSPR